MGDRGFGLLIYEFRLRSTEMTRGGHFWTNKYKFYIHKSHLTYTMYIICNILTVNKYI
jgi:hypothetical protein